MPNCGNGHVLGAHYHLTAQCFVCQRVLCNFPGCVLTCVTHGHAICRQDAVIHGRLAVCSPRRRPRRPVFAGVALGVGKGLWACLRPVLLFACGVIRDILHNYAGIGKGSHRQ